MWGGFGPQFTGSPGIAGGQTPVSGLQAQHPFSLSTHEPCGTDPGRGVAQTPGHTYSTTHIHPPHTQLHSHTHTYTTHSHSYNHTHSPDMQPHTLTLIQLHIHSHSCSHIYSYSCNHTLIQPHTFTRHTTHTLTLIQPHTLCSCRQFGVYR